MEIVSKSEFARRIGVSPSRVTRMIDAGKIGPEALIGEGRVARVNLDLAREHLAARLDASQRMGNGLFTQLDGPTAPDTPKAARGSTDPLADEIRAEKLRQLQFANRRAHEDALERQGRYVLADAVTAANARLAANLVSTFEGALTELAQTFAAKFSLPARDVTHLMRTEFRALRARAAATAREAAVSLPALIRDEVADALDDAVGEA